MAITLLGVGRLVGGRYVLEAPIGRGGMGEVWRARHATLASPAAIKFLHAASASSESSRRRFLTEAQVTANLKTKHAVQVFDFGVTDDGLPFLVMEMLDGETLERRIARSGRLSVGETARILQKAARALERAHQLGIVHRDFKPENIMLVDDDEEDGEAVKVVDFGVAKLVGGLDETLRSAMADIDDAHARGRSPSSFSVTSTGLGTPFYMAPEQVQGSSAQIGPAADIWAFGVVAYECLTGRRPFGGDTVGELLLRILTATLPRPASTIAPVPPAFDAWFEVACARDPARRFRDVQSAAAALVVALAPPAEPDVDAAAEGASIDDIEVSPRAESLAPDPPSRISSAGNLGSQAPVTPGTGPSFTATRAVRRHTRRTLAALALGALVLLPRDAPLHGAAPTASAAVTTAPVGPHAPDTPPATPVVCEGCASETPRPESSAPAATSAPEPSPAPHRTRAAAPRSRSRLPPLGL